MLETISKGMSDAVAGVSGGLVQLSARRALPATALAWKEDLLITAAHNLGRGEARAVLGDAVRPVAVLGVDPGTDLAVIRLEGFSAPEARWTEELPPVGALVLAVAAGPRATLGLVHARGGAWRTGSGGDVDAFIEVDGSLPAGFSGGPLLDAGGRVVGVNTRGLVPGGTTLPTSTVLRVAEQLARGGSVKQGWLGVAVQPMALHDGRPALLVVSVADGSPAGAGGLRVGDALLEVDGHDASTPARLLALLGARVGQKCSVKLSRGGQDLSVDLTVAEKPRRGRC